MHIKLPYEVITPFLYSKEQEADPILLNKPFIALESNIRKLRQILSTLVTDENSNVEVSPELRNLLLEIIDTRLINLPEGFNILQAIENLGDGEVLADQDTKLIKFKSIKAGDGVAVSSDSETITIENNIRMKSVGTGIEVLDSSNNYSAQFKTFKAGNHINIRLGNNNEDIIIEVLGMEEKLDKIESTYNDDVTKFSLVKDEELGLIRTLTSTPSIKLTQLGDSVKLETNEIISDAEYPTGDMKSIISSTKGQLKLLLSEPSSGISLVQSGNLLKFKAIPDEITNIRDTQPTDGINTVSIVNNKTGILKVVKAGENIKISQTNDYIKIDAPRLYPRDIRLADGINYFSLIADSANYAFKTVTAGQGINIAQTPDKLDISLENIIELKSAIVNVDGRIGSLVKTSTGLMKSIEVTEGLMLENKESTVMIKVIPEDFIDMRSAHEKSKTIDEYSKYGVIVRDKMGEFRALRGGEGITVENDSTDDTFITIKVDKNTTTNVVNALPVLEGSIYHSVIKAKTGVLKVFSSDSDAITFNSDADNIKIGLKLNDSKELSNKEYSLIKDPSKGIFKLLEQGEGILFEQTDDKIKINATFAGVFDAKAVTDSKKQGNLVSSNTGVIKQIIAGEKLEIVSDDKSITLNYVNPDEFKLRYSRPFTDTTKEIDLVREFNGELRVIKVGKGLVVTNDDKTSLIKLDTSGVVELKDAEILSSNSYSVISDENQILKVIESGNNITITSTDTKLVIDNDITLESVGAGNSIISSDKGKFKSIVSDGNIEIESTDEELRFSIDMTSGVSSAEVSNGTSSFDLFNSDKEFKLLKAGNLINIVSTDEGLTIDSMALDKLRNSNTLSNGEIGLVNNDITGELKVLKASSGVRLSEDTAGVVIISADTSTLPSVSAGDSSITVTDLGKGNKSLAISDSFKSGITSTLANLKTELDGKFTTFETGMNGKLNSLESKVDGKLATLLTQVNEIASSAFDIEKTIVYAHLYS